MVIVKIKTSELTGAALDWAVAKCEGYQAVYTDGSVTPVFRKCKPVVELATLCYSRDWSQAGPIINRLEGFELKVWLESTPEAKCEAHIHNYGGDWIQFGPTPLIAAMRCYVASKLGDEVEIPDELENT